MGETTLNNLPLNWSWVKLGDVCEILDNKRSPINSGERDKRISGKPIESLFPYYGATGQVGYIDDYLLEGEFVLLGEDGAPFLEKHKPKAYIVNGKIWVNNHAHILLSKNHNKFLCYYLNFLDYHPFVTGTTRLKLNQSSMRQIPIINPPLPEQKKIVEKIEELFSGLDNGVASLKKAKEQIRLYRQSVLASAFSGKLLTPSVERVVHSEMLKTAEPIIDYSNQLPEGWKWVKLGEISLKITDGEHLRPKVQKEGIPFLSAKDVRENDVTFENVLYVSEKDAEMFRKKCNPEKGDILIVSRGATVGRLCIIKTNKMFCLLGSVILIKVDRKINSSFIAYMIKSPQLNKQIINVSGSTAQQAIYLRDIKSVEIPLPTFTQQNQIVAEIEKQFSEADNLEKAIDESLAKSETLRQSILKQAFEGKLI